MPTPHKHAEVIHAYADGAKVEVLGQDGQWRKCPFPDFDPEWNYRIQTDQAAAKWPQTTMSEAELARHLMWLGMTLPGTPVLRPVADAAIRRAIETGQVVPASEKSELLAALHFGATRERELGEALHTATMALAKIQELDRKGIESFEMSTMVQRYLADAKQALFYGIKLDDLSRDQLLVMAFQGWKRLEELSFPDYSKLLNEADRKIESLRKRAERDMAVAKAVRSGIRRWSAPVSDDDLQKLIDQVK